MRTFIIGQYYANINKTAKSAAELQVAYAALQKEIRTKLNIADGYLGGIGPYEVAEWQGKQYIRSLAHNTYFVSLDSWRNVTNDTDKAQVLCPCGSQTFTIAYGDYKCIGTCTQCGMQHVLYDG